MILTCPFCQTRYLIPASTFAAGPRRVRCARCSHSWEASPPIEIDVVAAPLLDDVAPPPEEVLPIPEGSNLPVVQKQSLPVWVHGILGIAFLISVLLLILVLDRQTLVGHWPVLEGAYTGIGLSINHTGEGIHIEEVRSELQYESGFVRLIVEGKVHNTTEKNVLVPDMLASATGVNGQVIQSWQIDAPAAKLSPDETVPFRATIKAPEQTVADVNLEFVELKDASQ